MPRPKPIPSNELRYLRKVMKQDVKDDDVEDIELGQYRSLQIERPTWIFEQRRIAEKDHREELVAWQKECDKEASGVTATEERPLEPCEVVVSKMLDEWDKHNQDKL